MLATIVGSVVARVFDEGRRRGVPAEALTRALGRRRAALDGDDRVPIARLFECFALCLRSTRDAAFPLHVAARIELEDYAVLGFALMTSDSAAVACERLARYGHLITDSGAWRLRRGAAEPIVHLDWERAGARTLGLRAANECALAEVASGLRRVLGPAARPHAVRFRHRAPDDTRAHETFFGAPIRWGAAVDGIDLTHEALSLRSRAPHRGMSRFFADLLAQRAPAGSPLSSRVRDLVAKQLPSGQPTLRGVARELAMSERSLRRALTADGASYRALLDEVRRDAALELVRSGRSVTDIAFLLGFSETSALSRAYRRWYGTSIRDERQRRHKATGQRVQAQTPPRSSTSR